MAEYILKCVVNQLPKSERYAMGEQIRRLTVGIGGSGFDWTDILAGVAGISIAFLIVGV